MRYRTIRQRCKAVRFRHRPMSDNRSTSRRLPAIDMGAERRFIRSRLSFRRQLRPARATCLPVTIATRRPAIVTPRRAIAMRRQAIVKLRKAIVTLPRATAMLHPGIVMGHRATSLPLPARVPTILEWRRRPVPFRSSRTGCARPCLLVPAKSVQIQVPMVRPLLGLSPGRLTQAPPDRCDPAKRGSQRCLPR